MNDFFLSILKFRHFESKLHAICDFQKKKTGMRKKWKENCTMKTYFSRNEPFYFSCHATWFKSPGLGAFITQYNVLFWVETALRAVDVMDRFGKFYFYIMHYHVQWILPVFTWFYWCFSFLDPTRTHGYPSDPKLVSKPSFHLPRNPIHTLIKRFLETKTNLLGLWNHAGARRDMEWAAARELEK